MKLLAASSSAWFPVTPPTVAEWVPAHVIVPDELETPGPFDLDLVPHARGVLAAADDPDVREIYLRWSTRNGKTFTALCVLMALVAGTQRPGAIGNADEERVDDLIDNEFYPMLESCEATRSMLLKPWLRSRKSGVVVNTARIRRLFPKSNAKLGGYAACYVVCSEVGLWPMNAVNRVRQRARLFPYDSKIIYESKPENAGDCTISALCESETTQRRFRFVPCPHCGRYQRLVWGDGKPESAGLHWDSGKTSTRSITDARVARDTAYYQCEAGCKITSGERGEMMRRGVWVPDGCSVCDDGTITGEPLVEGRNVAFDELSALYSLGISGWGSLVSEFLNAQGNEESLREFTTGTLAKSWRQQVKVIEASSVSVRLKDETPLNVVPDWAVFLTRAFDVQTVATGIESPWGVCAWGPGGRGQLIGYGVAYGWDSVRQLLGSHDFKTPDGQALRAAWTVIDSGDGNVTEEVYGIANAFGHVLPSKGSSYPFQQSYRLGLLSGSRATSQDDLRKAAIRGLKVLFEVNSQRSQGWIQKHLEGQIESGDRARFSLASEAALDDYLMSELVNEHSIKVRDQYGFEKTRWTKKEAGKPNDMRDVVRYCWALAQFVTNDGKLWDKLPSRQAVTTITGTQQHAERQSVPAILQGGGRQWQGFSSSSDRR